MSNFNKDIVGTWIRPESGSYSRRITIRQDGTFTQIVSSKRGLKGIVSKTLDAFEGDQYDGNWHYDEKTRMFRVNYTKMPKSPVNLRILGLTIPVADWTTQFFDFFRHGEFVFKSFGNNSVTFGHKGDNKTEAWIRAG